MLHQAVQMWKQIWLQQSLPYFVRTELIIPLRPEVAIVATLRKLKLFVELDLLYYIERFSARDTTLFLGLLPINLYVCMQYLILNLNGFNNDPGRIGVL